jgi:hypothetical protein
MLQAYIKFCLSVLLGAAIFVGVAAFFGQVSAASQEPSIIHFRAGMPVQILGQTTTTEGQMCQEITAGVIDSNPISWHSVSFFPWPYRTIKVHTAADEGGKYYDEAVLTTSSPPPCISIP